MWIFAKTQNWACYVTHRLNCKEQNACALNGCHALPWALSLSSWNTQLPRILPKSRNYFTVEEWRRLVNILFRLEMRYETRFSLSSRLVSAYYGYCLLCVECWKSQLWKCIIIILRILLTSGEVMINVNKQTWSNCTKSNYRLVHRFPGVASSNY